MVCVKQKKLIFVYRFMIFKKSFIFEDLRDIRTVLHVSNAAHGPLLGFFSLFLLFGECKVRIHSNDAA